jgi:hypothetical protein
MLWVQLLLLPVSPPSHPYLYCGHVGVEGVARSVERYHGAPRWQPQQVRHPRAMHPRQRVTRRYTRDLLRKGHPILPGTQYKYGVHEARGFGWMSLRSRAHRMVKPQGYNIHCRPRNAPVVIGQCVQ